MPSASSLRRRNQQPELMDQAELDPAEHHQALQALGRINRLSGTVQAIWPFVRRFYDEKRRAGDLGPLRLLDVATGGGDLPVAIWSKARRQGICLEVSGCDRSPLAVEHSRDRARRENADVSFFEIDVLQQTIPAGYDIITTSLFLHHLNQAEAVELLRTLGSAGELVLVDDLRRSAAGWWLAYLGVRLLSRSRLAHVDGPLSVEGAFTCEEARAMAVQAGWHDFQVRPRWPCRFLLVGRARQ